MVSGTKIDGGTHVLSAGVRKTIQQIKEIVGNHSDADIYVTLKETNMDPNETAQKLLYQGRSPLSPILSLPTLIFFPSRPYLFAGINLFSLSFNSFYIFLAIPELCSVFLA